jgi:hypothetical protein
MQGENLPKICNTVIHFFKKTIIRLDKVAKFAKRKSKLGAQLFAETLVAGCLLDPTISLERLCRLCKQRGVKISKQGLHQRFNSEATVLMKNFFLESIEQFKTEKCNLIDLLKPFSSLYMIDSSGISLPAALKDSYRGYGGSASEAGLKIQVLFDYLQGQINQVTITEGCRSDQSFDGHLSQIEENSLHLQDLGYFKFAAFAAIQAKNAYFISRFLHPTIILNEKNEEIDILNILRKSGSFFADNVWLGRNEKIGVRLVAFRLSDKDVEKRIRKIKKAAQRKGKTPTANTLELACWSIYITNVPEDMLNNEQVHLVYSLRWQIELFFKLGKSEAGIAKVSGKKSNRVLCEIYAKLICIVTLLYLCFPFRWEKNQELSFQKAYKELKLRAIDFFKALQSPYRLLEFMKFFFSDLQDFAYKDKYRKGRRLSYQKLMDSTGQEVLA